MKIEVANGEIVDKVTILRIKLSRIEDPARRRNIQLELAELLPAFDSFYSTDAPLYAELCRANDAGWDCIDRLTELESEGRLGPEYIEVAREAFRLNDERARIKRKINEATGSRILEEKNRAL